MSTHQPFVSTSDIETNPNDGNSVEHVKPKNGSDTSTLEDIPQDYIEDKENIELNKTHACTSWIKYALGDIYADDDPNDLSDRRKNIIIAIVAFGGVSGPLGRYSDQYLSTSESYLLILPRTYSIYVYPYVSMIYMPALLRVAQDLHTTSSAVNGTVSAYVIFMGVAVSY